MFGSSNSKTAPSISTLRAQSAIYGVVLPSLRGTNRLPVKLIDWTDFKAIAHEQSTGGKGMGGGQSTTYTYEAAVDLALAMTEGCVRIGKIWDGQGEYGNGQMIEQITLPSGNPGSYTPVGVTDGDYSYDVGVSLVTEEQVWVPAYDPATGLPQGGGAPGVGDGYYETVNVFTPMAKVGGSNPAQGKYSITGSGDTLAYLFNAADAGKDAKLVYGLTVDIASEFAFFSGSRPQSPWSYMLGRYPTRALAYAGTCHIAAPAFQLGTSGTVDNLNVELVGPGVFGGDIQDASIDQCIHLVLDDPDGGCGFPTALIGELTDAIAYASAAGFFFSPICDTAQTAATYLQDFCDAANIAPSWEDGLLKFIPYGDRPVAGNGYSYVPDLTPVYDLDDDDFIADADEDALKIEGEDPEGLSNIFEIDIKDRALSYNTHPILDKDTALIFRYGRIPASSKKYDFICDVSVASKVANHIRLRATQIDTLNVSFKLGPEYDLLAKMDIVTITNKRMGWTKKPFRLIECDENPLDEESNPQPGECEWTAEPVLWGSCNATLYPKQLPGGGATQRDAAPGSILPPIIFEAPDPLIATGEYELWLGLCGAALANWGGCHNYGSSDGNTYKNILPGQQGPSRVGVLTTDFPALASGVAGLDAINTLAVDLSESDGTLLSGTADDRDSFRTLCWIEGVLHPIAVAPPWNPNSSSWTNPQNASSTSAVATINASGTSGNQVLFVQGMPAVAPGATITGVGVSFKAMSAVAGAELICAAGNGGAVANAILTAAMATYSFGGDGNMWGLSASQLTEFQFAAVTSGANNLVSVNDMVITVYYTLPGYELVSYETATLTSGNKFNITSLQRGAYGTPVIDHPAGMRFLRCDDAVTKLTFSAEDVAKAFYFKATSFNQYGLAEEALETVAEYSYVVQGSFNNSGQIVANNATVDYDATTLTSAGVTIRTYGTTVPGSVITFKKQDGTAFTCSALTLANAALVTTYYAMLNRAANAPYWLSSYSEMLTAIGNGHVCIGSVTTPAAGGSGGSTGGGGGTSGGGGGTCFSGNVAIRLVDILQRFDELPKFFYLRNETGIHLAELLVHDYDGPMIDFTGGGELVTPPHLMKDGAEWIPAGMFYEGCKIVQFKGKVYNLHVLSENPEDLHYELSNGDIAHNNKIRTD